MADDTTQRGAADRARINMNQDYEVRDAMRAFGATREELEEAIRRVGNRRTDVEAELRRAKGR